MRLIAESNRHPVSLLVLGDRIGDVAMDIAVWLDHNGRQSGVGTLHEDPPLISAALEEVDLEILCRGERFHIVVDCTPTARQARFEVLGEVPEPLLGTWGTEFVPAL